jgi:hypothetical protein
MLNKGVALATVVLSVSGCQDLDYEINPEWLAQNCPAYLADLKVNCAMPDLAPPQPKCAAAKGLTGDALLCVDFDKLSSLTDQAVAGWNFTGNCIAGWEIATGKLQVKNFGTFVGTCSFTMPLTDLASPANQKYQSVTLAVVQRVDLNDKPAQLQTQQIMLGLDDPSRRIEFRTGSNPRQQNINAVSRGDLTAISGTSFQPLFKVTSSLASGATATGVQIESIAVMGNP